MKALYAAVAGSALLASTAFVVHLWPRPYELPQSEPAVTLEHPTLYCEFYNFTHNATVVAFNFAVGRDPDANLTFSELFVVENNTERTDFVSDFPKWTYKVEEGTPEIVSPDTETRIILYGLKPTAAGIFWTEAGIRNNSYRNLEGKCRQAHLNKAVVGKPETP